MSSVFLVRCARRYTFDGLNNGSGEYTLVEFSSVARVFVVGYARLELRLASARRSLSKYDIMLIVISCEHTIDAGSARCGASTFGVTDSENIMTCLRHQNLSKFCM